MPSLKSSVTGMIATVVAICCAGGVRAEVVGVVTLKNGDFVRGDAPVSVVLPESIDPSAVTTVHQLGSGGAGELRAEHQFDPAEPRRLWFIPPAKIGPGETRHYELRAGQTPEQSFALRPIQDEKTLTISWGDRRVLQYNHAPVPPPAGVDPAFTRSGYIHPMWTPSGKLVTEDHPGDHYHHKGIWFPWTRTKFEGREVDFWNLGEKQGTVRFAGFESTFSGPVFAGFIAKHEHVDLTAPGGEKIALNETWDVRVYAVAGPHDESPAWVWDLTSTQTCATDSPLELMEYRYGGLGFRGAKEWVDDNYLARASNGKTHKDGHTTRAKWCDHAGKVEGEYCGVLILGHPENFRFPEPMRLWERGGAFFNWAPVQAGDFAIEPGKPHVSRYRFIVHDGDLSIEECERLWREYGEAPEISFQITSDN